MTRARNAAGVDSLDARRPSPPGWCYGLILV
jgi:hypothetical protein